MLRSARSAAHWVGRHAFPAIAATVIVVGAAGAGIGYAVARQHATAAPTSSSSSASKKAPSSATTVGGRHPGEIFHSALSLLATQTGQTVTTVRRELAAGKSFDAIAGVKAPAIESAILAQISKRASRDVSAGRISAAQETAGLAMAKTKIKALMAEPGTQFLKDARKALQFLQGHGLKHSAPPAATAPTPAA